MKKISNYLTALVLISVVFAVVVQIPSFTGQSNPFNITFHKDLNFTFDTGIPTFAISDNLTMELRGFLLDFYENNSLLFKDNSLIGYWKLDDNNITIVDVKDNGKPQHNLTFTGDNVSPDKLQQSPIPKYSDYSIFLNNKAAEANKLSNETVSLRNALNSMNETSISFWAAENPTAGTGAYVSFVDHANTGGWSIWNAGGTIYYLLFTVDGEIEVSLVNKRHSLITCMRNSTGISIWLNDTSLVYKKNNSAIKTADTNFSIGARYSTVTSSYDNFLIGVKLDNVAIFNKSLTKQELGVISTGLSYPTNASIMLPNGAVLWNYAGFFNTAKNISLDVNIINSYQDSSKLKFTSNSSGILQVNLTNASYSFGIDNCSTYGNRTLNFTIQEETNLTPLSADVDGTFTFTGNGIDEYNYSISIDNVQNFSICIYPGWANLTVDAYLQYESTNGFRERYYLVNSVITNITKLVKMYNFNTQDGISELTGIIKNEIYNEMPNIIVKMLRYYSSTNIWRSVQIDKTDEFGKVIFYVIQNEEDYKFIFEREGTQIDSTNPVKFSCDSSTECEQTFVIYEDEAGGDFGGMTGVISHDAVNELVTFTWNDPQNTANSVRLLVEKHATDKVITICNTESTSAAGSIVCNISAYDGIITARAFRASSPYTPWIVKFIENAAKLADLIPSTDGMFFSGLIMMTLIGFGVGTGSALVVVILGSASLVFVYLFQLTSVLNITLVITGFCISLIVAYMVRK